MNIKFNTNLQNVNFFVIFLFIIYLLGLVLGPLLVNIFIFSLFIIFIQKLRQNNLYLIRNFDLAINLQILFFIYLIFNSYFIGGESSLFYKSLFYFRFFLIAFIISNILNFKFNTLEYLSLAFLVFSFLLSVDIFYQYITGYDFFGFKPGICTYPGGTTHFDPKNCERFSGFFGKELIAGNFLATYGLMFLYLFYSRYDQIKYVEIISLILLITFVFAVILSGERNSIIALLIIFIFNIIFNNKFRKKLLYILSLFIIIFSILFASVSNVKYRYFEWPIQHLDSMKSYGAKKLLDTSWGSHYITAYEIYLDNKIFGSGFKSFRNECSESKYDYKKLNNKYDLNMRTSGCSSHPHNLYLEVLSELGLSGFVLFLLLLYFTIFKPFISNYKYIRNESEIVILLSIILTYIFPFKPSGSFSSSVFSTNLWFFIGFYLYFVNNLNNKIKSKKN